MANTQSVEQNGNGSKTKEIPVTAKPMIEEVRLIPIDQILIDDAWNVRSGDWKDKASADLETGESFEGLVQAIAQSGLKTRIVVQLAPKGAPKPYILREGFRRTAACKQLLWKEIPAVIRSYENETDARFDNLLENVARKNLKPADLAWGIGQLVKAEPKLTGTVIGRRLDLSQTYVSLLLSIFTNMKPGIFKAWRESAIKVSVEEARAVAMVEKDQQEQAWAAVVGGSNAGSDEEEGKKKKSSWVDKFKKSAGELGFNLGTMQRLGYLEDLKGEWLDIVENVITMPDKAVKRHRESVANALEKGFNEGLKEPPTDSDE